MIRALRLAVLLFVCALAVQANPDLVKVKVRVILVDRDLNQKPVPFLLVSLKNGAKSSEVKTGLDGTVETQLPPGKYMITTPKPAELGDRRFSWNMTLAITGAQATVDLTNENPNHNQITAPASASSGESSGGGDLTEHFKRRKNTVGTVITR